MTRTLAAAALAAALAATTACAKDVIAHYPSIRGEPTSSLVLLFGQPATGVMVTIDGWLVVDDVHTSRIVVDGVPIGTREVAVAANGAEKDMKLWVGGDHATTVPLGVPDASMGFLKTIAGTLITLLAYTWLK
jgi:hypothetical protein